MRRLPKAVIAALLLSATLLGATACGESGSTNDTTEGTKEPVNIAVADLAKEISDAYGDEYMVDTDIDADILDAMFGVKPEWYDEFFGQMPMIGFHTDILVIVKAKEGHVADVENALKGYYDSKVGALMNYPQQVPKIKAAQVKSYGNYVFYISLGIIDDNLDTENEAAAIKHYEERNKVALDIIESKLG